MDQSVVESNQPTMELNKATDLTATRIAKCPKPFSIESIISSNDSKAVNIGGGVSPNYEKTPDPSVYFPSNVSMATAASLYNPWFHNYFIQQQKVAGNVLEMMQMNGANQTTIKEKFTEIFANSSLANQTENRAFLSSINDPDRNLGPTTTRSIEQYFGNVENMHEMRFNEMISGVNNDYYKHLSSYGIHCVNPVSDNFEKCKKQLMNSDEHETVFHHKNAKLSSDNDKNTRNDDSGADENPDDEMDSDCNSEISLDMSPDGDNNTQGIVQVLFTRRSIVDYSLLEICP